MYLYISFRKILTDIMQTTKTRDLAYLPTYAFLTMKRRTEEGLKFSFLTKNVSTMSKTGIANICS